MSRHTFLLFVEQDIQISDQWKKKKEKGLSFDLQQLSDVLEDSAAFLTCDKCSMVFGDSQDAWIHEENCTCILQEGGRVFKDKDVLIQFLIHFRSREGKVPNEGDLIYFVSSEEEYHNYYQHYLQQEEQRGDAVESSPEDDEKAESNVNTDVNTNEQGEEYPTTDMNLVKHLCSTTINPSTGLPTQKLTVMCGDSGEIMMLYYGVHFYNALGANIIIHRNTV